MNKIKPARIVTGGIGDYLPILRTRASKLRRLFAWADTDMCGFGYLVAGATIAYVVTAVILAMK